MKALYLYDVNTSYLTGMCMVSDSYTPQAGQSLLRPDDGLYEPIKHSVDVDGHETWIGTPKEEWEKAHPGTPVKPTEQQQLTMAQQADITQLQKMVMNQQSTMTQMQKTIMAQQSTITELKKGAN